MNSSTPLHPSDSPGFLLWRTTLRWQRELTQALAPLELTHIQFVLLTCTWWMNQHGEQPRQNALAAQAGTDIKMTSQVVRGLERKGLIEREVDETDARARRLRGARRARRAIAVVEQTDGAFFAEGPTGQALSVLRRLAGPVDGRAAAEASAGRKRPPRT